MRPSYRNVVVPWKIVKARKAHICAACDGEIQKGKNYYRAETQPFVPPDAFHIECKKGIPGR